MRISDWSSDVCSSDLVCPVERRIDKGGAPLWLSSPDCWPLHSAVLIEVMFAPADIPHKRCPHMRQTGLSNHRLINSELGILTAIVPIYSRECDDRSEEHTSELQSLMRISSAVFCLNTKNTNTKCTPLKDATEN